MCCQRYFRARTLNRAVPFNVLFLWQRYFLYKTVLVSRASTSLSTRSFCERILFMHLKALRGDELRLVRTVGMVRLDEILFEILSKKWHEHWDHHHKLTVAHRLHKPMLLSNQYNLDLKPPSFISHQGIHALQQPSFCLDYWDSTSSFSSERITYFPPTRFSVIYACRFSYLCTDIVKCA